VTHVTYTTSIGKLGVRRGLPPKNSRRRVTDAGLSRASRLGAKEGK
jgi:hypothetical protein